MLRCEKLHFYQNKNKALLKNKAILLIHTPN